MVEINHQHHTLDLSKGAENVDMLGIVGVGRIRQRGDDRGHNAGENILDPSQLAHHLVAQSARIILVHQIVVPSADYA